MSAGRPLNWVRHFARLRFDCGLLGLEAPEESVVRAEISRIAPPEAVVKVILTRGVSDRGYGIAGAAQPTRIVAAFAPADYPAELAAQGVRVRRCAIALSEQPRTAGAKTLNRLENVLARSEWDDPAIREGLIADAARRVIGGTMSNVFVVRNGLVATPDLSRCGVIGAQRERVRDLLEAEGIECLVRDVASEELEDCEEIFLTNSLIGIWPVIRLEDRQWAPGPVARRLQSLLERDDGQDR